MISNHTLKPYLKSIGQYGMVSDHRVYLLYTDTLSEINWPMWHDT